MTDINRHEIPAGGWQWYQPQTGWRAPTPINSTFDQTVVLILNHRLANKPVVAKFNLATDKYTIGNELEDYQRKRLGLPGRTEIPKNMPLSPSAPGAGAGAVAGVKRAAIGVGTIKDWLGDGLLPVSHALAEARGRRCVTCPQNQDPNWFQKLEGVVADQVKALMAVKHDLNLSTPVDEQLNTCQMCDCRLRLKVWTPLKHVLGRLKPLQKVQLETVMTTEGKHCWIIEESK